MQTNENDTNGNGIEYSYNTPTLNALKDVKVKRTEMNKLKPGKRQNNIQRKKA
jgi:hypothetical protein